MRLGFSGFAAFGHSWKMTSRSSWAVALLGSMGNFDVLVTVLLFDNHHRDELSWTARRMLLDVGP